MVRLTERRLSPPRFFLLLILLLAAGLHFANLQAIGHANSYYTAAVQAMLRSGRNFFFVAAEPGGSVTVDKPPLGLWIEALFAALLGVNGVAVSLPNMLAGIASVLLLYALVKRSFGTLAGLVAALALTLTPVFVAANRNNTMEGMLVFCLLLVAWAFLQAAEEGHLRWLLIGATLMGLAFNIKMFQAFLPLPAFYALYFFGARIGWRQKLWHLAAATALLLAISFSWALAVDLTPEAQRPYVGSTQTNRVMELIFGHNGLERLSGEGRRPGGALAFGDGAAADRLPPQAGGLPPTPPPEAVEACRGRPERSPCTVHLGDGQSFSGVCARLEERLACFPEASAMPAADTLPAVTGGLPGRMFTWEIGSPSALRLFVPPLAKETAWLLPFGGLGLALLAISTRMKPASLPTRQALLLWGGWLLIGMVFFSLANFFHAHYLVMLAPPLAAMAGSAVDLLWRAREHPWARGVLGLAATATLAYQWALAVHYGQDAWWLRLAALLSLAGWLALAVRRRPASFRFSLAFGFFLSAVLVVPFAWSVLTVVRQAPDNPLPAAYRGREKQEARPGQSSDFAPFPVRPDEALLTYLQAHTQDVEYLVAVPDARVGAPLVLASGRPVLYLGGFGGSDPVVMPDDLEAMVATGRLRFFLFGDRPGRPEILRWVVANCAVVTEFAQRGQVLYDCSARK